MSPSPLLAVDPRLSDASAQRTHLVALQQLAAQVEAAYLDTLVALLDSTPVHRQVEVPMGVEGRTAPGGTRSLDFCDEDVDQVAALLHRTHGSIAHDLRHARLLHGPLTQVAAALAAGEITGRHARAIATAAARMQVTELGEDAADDAAFRAKCAHLQELILPIARRSTPGATESRADRLVARIDAQAEARRRERARARVDVFARAEGDGLASITAILTSIDAAKIMATITHQVATHGDRYPDAQTVGQVRAAALLDLLGLHSPMPSSSTAPGITAEIHVVVDAATLLAAGAAATAFPAWVQVGAGSPSAVNRDQVLALLADPGVPTALRRLLVDPVTGALIDRGATRYAPNDDLIAWLAARDRTCRFPGCTALPSRCDVDHATDFSEGFTGGFSGPTTIANTGLLCRRHHNRKTHGGWRIESSQPDGSCTFVDPEGMRHRHLAAPLLE